MILTVRNRWLLVPSFLSTSAVRHRVELHHGASRLHHFEIPVSADGSADAWPAIDLGEFLGAEITVKCDSAAFHQNIRFSDTPPEHPSLYEEPLRPRFHFSVKTGWLNDPNGLVFYRGEYHLFYQYNPYFTEWGNMHWGHAVSTDLVRWTELDIALYPDATGAMFSGSAVVDWNNTSGLGDGRHPPLIILYTAASDYSSQCLAYSHDGRTFRKYTGNPVLPQIRAGNRDNKVLWDSERARWLMVVYVPEPAPDRNCERHTVEFWSSPNLLRWTRESVTTGGTDKDLFLFECPDFFRLPVNGNPSEQLWVLIGANCEYQVGEFNGTHFRPLTGRMRGIHGDLAYAGQTFNDEPNGRRILVEWLRAPSPGMAFNQCMSVPLELSLHKIGNTFHLASHPVTELEKLRQNSRNYDECTLNEGASLLELPDCDTFDLTLHLAANSCGELAIGVGDARIVYHASPRVLCFAGETLAVPDTGNGTALRILGDRTTLEVFAEHGLVCVLTARDGGKPGTILRVQASRGPTHIHSAAFHELAGSWVRAASPQ